MNDILYVTSFNKRLFDATGKRMINSFIEKEIEGDLLIAHEEGVGEDVPYHENFIYLDLDSYQFLHDWLEENIDIIPKEFGGNYEGDCDCHSLPKSKLYYKNHVLKCLNLGWNRRASRWFRKIASLNYGLNISENNNYEKIIFIDSDIVFKKKITKDFIENAFKNNGVFFHLGEQRRMDNNGIESGFIGFNRQNKGFEFLKISIDKFTSGDFKQYHRWDDSYIFRSVWEEHPEIPCRDVVGRYRPELGGHVVKHGLFASYIDHEKGSHTKKYKIF